MARKARQSRILVLGKSLPEPVLDNPAPDEFWIHDQLERWAEWCRPQRQQGQAGSAEGNHRAEKGNVYTPVEPRKMFSVEEARAVNEALLQLPEQQRAVLRARYYLRWPDRMMCGRFNLKHDVYGVFMRTARMMLLSILTRAASLLGSPLPKRREGSILPADNSPSVLHDEKNRPSGRADHSIPESDVKQKRE